MVQSAKSNTSEKKPYVKPIHYGCKAILSETIVTQFDTTNTKEFDFNITLSCIGNKQKISIPLKRNKQFNKWNTIGKRAKSVILTDKYVQITFEIETGKKKEPNNNYLGIDIGMNKLVATSDGNFIGKEIRTKLNELQLKKRCSKAYYRKKEEIKEYINYQLKQLPFKDLSLIVVEKLRNVKHKTKLKLRLSKNMRRVISNWNYRHVLDRIQALCEESRTTFRSVNPFYTSRECSVCGHTDKRNRLSQESFKCLKCGHSENADVNASKVILNRFLTGQYGACFKSLQPVKIL